MKIGIIDADLIGRKRHRFPNLACMKLSGYYKETGNRVQLLLNYKDLAHFDIVYISKVFTDTSIPSGIITLPNVRYGGTGFFYDKALPLPYEIEHHMPDYYLYADWVEKMLGRGAKPSELEYYTSYSIGYTTRKCFRQCEFCINKNYTSVELHSPIEEFLDVNRKYICLLDDNILGYLGWGDILIQLNHTNKRFQFKQGMDERLLTSEKAKLLSNCKYKGDYIFAFDNIEDKELIKTKLTLWKTYCYKATKLYILCGFDRFGKYDTEFWERDIISTFERIKILMQFGCLPYLMRFNKYAESPYKGTYINLARWCNQPSLVKKKSYREFVMFIQSTTHNGECSALRYLKDFELDYPDIANAYYDLKYENLNQYTRTLVK